MEPIDSWLDDALGQVAPAHSSPHISGSQPDALASVPPTGAQLRYGYNGKEHFETFDEPDAESLAAEMANLMVSADAMPKGDAVVLPKHYARYKIEPVRFCIENNLNGFQFNIIKYILRHDAKNGLEDLRKARRYLDMFIRFVEGDEDWWR